MDFLLITGMSGAGKSLALNYFEDRGYFCVDNLPPALISKFAELCLQSDLDKIALVSDIRGREFFNELFAELANIEKMNLNYNLLHLSLISFGFKYGIPRDADLVMDVRFLPNPYYVESLREKTGNDQEVQEYVLKWPSTEKFYTKFFDLIDFLLPEYKKEGKSHLSVAIGCTGGKHRSVTTVNKLAEFLKEQEFNINIEHRDIEK